METHLHARIPRVQCPEHGVVQVAVPWAEGRGRFTLLMERFIIQALLACQTTKGACALLRISWDQAWHVAERAVARGQARKEAVVTRQIQRRLENVVSYCKHFVTNAVAEGLNSKIMSIKRRAGGFRNAENFKTAIYFHCGGLSLYP